ncbi:MAG: YybH family protein [Thermodesulfobacteriota bacterium]
MKFLFTIQAFVLCLLLFSLTACGKKTSDEEAIRETVRAAATSVEEKDLKTLMGLISRGFYDNNGNDYKGLKGMLFYQFMRPGKLKVFLRGVRISVEGGNAVLDAKVFVMRGRDLNGLKGIIPRDAEGFKVSAVLEKDDGRWKVLSARWNEAGLAGIL